MNLYKSYSKLNLFLDVIKLRKDNYHNIRSIFCEIDLYDSIYYEKNNINKIRIFDKKNILPEDNLLKKAGDIFIKKINKIPYGIDFYIEKVIPVGGGLGGGSSNASSVLKILNKEWNINFSIKKLEKIAKKIGSDVPFFIKGGIQEVTGTGDKLKKINLNSNIKLNILLIIPDFSVSTPYAYNLIDKAKLSNDTKENKLKYKNLIIGLKQNNYQLIVNNIYNKFEEVVFKEFRELEKIKKIILDSGADVSFMSGSGSTMVGIYKDLVLKNNAINFFKDKNIKFFDVNLIYN